MRHPGRIVREARGIREQQPPRDGRDGASPCRRRRAGSRDRWVAEHPPTAGFDSLSASAGCGVAAALDDAVDGLRFDPLHASRQARLGLARRQAADRNIRHRLVRETPGEGGLPREAHRRGPVRRRARPVPLTRE